VEREAAVNRPAWFREGHGTDARARRHYREGLPPGRTLRDVCGACAEAARRVRYRRVDNRRAGRRRWEPS
jgi:hypothetical protein